MPIDSEDPYYRMGKAAGKHLNPSRSYPIFVSIVEVFLRKGMGVRYFKAKHFFAGLMWLIIFHIIIDMGKLTISWQGMVFQRVYVLDAFIVLYLIFCLSHFIKQWRNRRAGINYYSYFIGHSRLAFIARWLKLKKHYYFTYCVMEPLFTLCFAFVVLFYSGFLAVMVILAAGRLLWENYRVLNHEYQDYLNRVDSLVFAQYASKSVERQQMTVSDQSYRDLTENEPVKPFHRPHHISLSSTPNVKEALKNLNPQLKNLGEKK